MAGSVYTVHHCMKGFVLEDAAFRTMFLMYPKPPSLLKPSIVAEDALVDNNMSGMNMMENVEPQLSLPRFIRTIPTSKPGARSDDESDCPLKRVDATRSHQRVVISRIIPLGIRSSV